MAAIFFVVGLGLLIGIVLRWGFKTLPNESGKWWRRFPWKRWTRVSGGG